MSSGVLVNPECQSAFQQLSEGKRTLRYIIYKIEEKEVVVESAKTPEDVSYYIYILFEYKPSSYFSSALTLMIMKIIPSKLMKPSSKNWRNAPMDLLIVVMPSLILNSAAIVPVQVPQKWIKLSSFNSAPMELQSKRRWFTPHRLPQSSHPLVLKKSSNSKFLMNPKLLTKNFSTNWAKNTVIIKLFDDEQNCDVIPCFLFCLFFFA